MSGTRESFGWALQPGSCSLIGTDCPHCKGMSLRMLHSRTTLVFRDELLAFSCLLHLHVLWNWERSSRTMKSSRSHLMMTQIGILHISHSPSYASSPVLFTQADFHLSSGPYGLITFGESDNEDNAILSSLWRWGMVHNSRGVCCSPSVKRVSEGSEVFPLGSDAELFRVLNEALEELSLEWSPPPLSLPTADWMRSVSSQATTKRAPHTVLPFSSQRFTRSWQLVDK